MTDSKGTASSSIWIIALAALAAVAALLLVSKEPDEGPASTVAPERSETATSPPARAPGGESPGELGTPEGAPSAPSPSETAAPSATSRTPGLMELGPMPPEVAEAFAKGTVPVTDRELDELRGGRVDIPPDVLRDFESAGRQRIPPEILEDFENPYPPIPPEELERLRANGRSPGAQ